MPGLVPGMMLLGGLPLDPGVIVAVHVVDRQDHESRGGISVGFFHRFSHRFGHRGARFDEHYDFFRPLNFALPPIVRDHPRQDIDATRKQAVEHPHPRHFARPTNSAKSPPPGNERKPQGGGRRSSAPPAPPRQSMAKSYRRAPHVPSSGPSMSSQRQRFQHIALV